MKKVTLSKAKDDLSRFLRVAAKEEVLARERSAILQRIEAARISVRSGRGVSLEEIDKTPNASSRRTQKARRRRTPS